MLKKLIFTLVFICIPFLSSFSIPSSGVKRLVTLPDGSVVVITLRGDEDFHFWTTEDGRSFIENKGMYEPISSEEVNSTWKKLHRKRGLEYDKAFLSRRRDGKSPNRFVGKKKGLVILMEFKDVKFSVSSDIHKTYSDYFNKVGCNFQEMNGSVHDYFYDQSYGQFDLTFDIAGPYTSKLQMAYYGQNNSNGSDAHAVDLVKEACDAAAKEYDMSNYDWDGDKEVDQVYVIYAGYGEAQGAEENTIWPHEYYLRSSGLDTKYGNTKVDKYAISCELKGDSGVVIDGIGTACHEFSHCMGLPDMYDTDYSGAFGTGSWDILCSGSYNNGGNTPAGYTSYERWFAGWLEPVELSSMTMVDGMKPLENAGEAYVMYNDANQNEYYLLENRQPVKWDKGLSGHGLLVLHVDYNEYAWSSNSVNDSPSHQRMVIVPADGSLSRNNLAGDPFPGEKGITALNKTTSPSNSLYNQNTDGTYFLNKNLDNISESEDGFISFVACRPDPKEVTDLEIIKESETSLTVRWPKVENADSYTVSLKEVPAINHDYSENLLLEENFAKFYSKSVGFTDVSSNVSKYVSVSGWAGEKMFCTPKYLRLGTGNVSGYFITPKHDMVNSAEVTFIVSYELFDQDTPVTGYSRCRNTKKIFEQNDFNLTENGYFVFHATNIDDEFYFSFVPDSRIYVNHVYILEGNWTADEISRIQTSGVRSRGLHRVKVSDLTTTETFVTFENLDPTSTYYVKVRSNNSVVSSYWSEEKFFSFDSPSSVSEFRNESYGSSILYDFAGRQATSSAKGFLLKRTINTDGSTSTHKVFVK